MFSSFPGSLPEFNKAFGDILEAPKGVTKWMPPGTSPRKTEVSRDADESEGDPPAPPPGGGSGANKSGSGSGGGSGGGKDDDDDKVSGSKCVTVVAR